ncbi:hypothetical protein INT48_005564 [Thamnidium elegans]|uniref:SEC7 domain-containing protein n=1 Tax=Thamnidium elegans TaxID=101142 RepID=A0A8H7SZY1_9FUNG|nr:hypothetical protein INT48_005564 [Thamnidium elegans]
MLPNSRIIPPLNNNSSRSRSSSTSGYESNSKKGFISRLLANPNTPSNYPSKTKYESVLGINNDKDYATWGRPADPKPSSSIKSTSSSSSSGGFGKLFKKRGKTVDDTEPTVDDDLPKVRPIHNNSIRRTHTKIPLAPPPVMSKRHTQLPDQLLSDLPDQYITKRPVILDHQRAITPEPARSSSSIRKSSGSYSIYSTFGGNGSVYSVEKDDHAAESVESFNTVVTSAPTDQDDDDDDDETTTTEETNEDDDDSDDDAFVDATGSSQEDIEREKRIEREKPVEINKGLSKRLSGGHFGSAGGLLLSINPESDPPPVPKRRGSHKLPADDELSKSMLNWKRHSDNSKRWSSTLRSIEDKHASSATVVDLRSTEITNDTEEELSGQDKIELRKKAELTLSGADIPKIVTTLASLSIHDTTHTNNNNNNNNNDNDNDNNDTSSTAELFSKTIDDVWKTSDDTSLDLFNDDRTKQIQTSIQNIENQDKIEDKIKERAQQLWEEDETAVTKEKMAEWLGQGKPFNSAVLYQYMDYFYFSDMRLDDAFRKLCSKLYFKAEAQQIDRILETFANRYWDCNQECLYGSADVVYAVVYSLLLLNTDLHVAQGNHARMTRSEFIRNTMSTIRDQREHEELMGHKRSAIHTRNWEAEVENTMKEMYISVKQYQILQPLSRKTSLGRRSSMMGKRVIGIKRSTSLSPPPRSSMSSGYNRSITPSIKSPRRGSFSSATSSSATSLSSRCGSPTSLAPQPMIQYMDTHSSSLFSSRPPYFKEGVVMRKHLLENASHKAKHREWKECFLEVGQDGELRMYALQQPQQLGDKSLFRHSSAVTFNQMSEKMSKTSISSSFSGPNSSKWGSTSQLIGKIPLNHTLSNPLPPPGYNRQRPHVFAIQQSDGGVYLFQAASAEQTQEWVATCNYWAARESKEPLPGGVGNMEYGWGSCLDDVIMDLDAMRKGYDQKHYVIHTSQNDPDSIFIQDWLPPSATMVSSQMDEQVQYQVLQKHLVELNAEINQHRDLKTKIMIKFPSKCNNYQKVMNNWEARSKKEHTE